MALAYITSSSARAMARLRSVELLEQAMRARDVNGRELARSARTSAQTVSQLRTGARLRVRVDVARRLEHALRVSRGFLFLSGSERPVSAAETGTDAGSGPVRLGPAA